MRTAGLITLGVIVAVVLLFGCPKQQESPPPEQQPPSPAPTLTGLPIELDVKQRTTTVVPGSAGAVSLTIDDITRRQAMVSLSGQDGIALLAPTSLVEGKSAEFKLDGESYFVTLENLDNELVGDDSARFVISETLPSPQPTEKSPAGNTGEAPSEKSEKDKINELIEHVGSLDGAVFIRNGQEHAPADAAEHLRRKWEYASDEIATAEEFIDQLASKSSTTGDSYRIRLKDGSERPSGEYLRERLVEMDDAAKPK